MRKPREKIDEAVESFDWMEATERDSERSLARSELRVDLLPCVFPPRLPLLRRFVRQGYDFVSDVLSELPDHPSGAVIEYDLADRHRLTANPVGATQSLAKQPLGHGKPAEAEACVRGDEYVFARWHYDEPTLPPAPGDCKSGRSALRVGNQCVDNVDRISHSLEVALQREGRSNQHPRAQERRPEVGGQPLCPSWCCEHRQRVHIGRRLDAGAQELEFVTQRA
jgi:hypothetical protein